jgi:hypothetical protein
MTKLRLRSKVNFPANVTADGGIAVRKESGQWVVYPKFSDLVSIAASSVQDPTTQQVWIYNPAEDTYAVLTLGGLGDALFKLTSTTSNSIGLGSKTFTVQPNKDVGVGQYVLITDDAAPASNGMYGKITDYTGSSLTVSVEGVIGSGTKTAWTIRVSGATGATGATGTTGSASGVRQTYSTTTADADPGAGTFRLNNATPSSATAAYLDNLDAGGATVSGIFDTWDDSTNTTKGLLFLQKTTDPTVWASFRVTGSVVDGTGYRKLTLSSGSGSGAFTNGDTFTLTFSPAGDAGTNGAVAISGTPSVGQFAIWTNATTEKGVSITGIVKGNGASDPSAATAGTDYVKPDTATAFTKHQYFTLSTLTDAANISWDVAAGQKAKVTLGGNRTMNAVTGAVEGATYFLWVIQDATGSRTLSWTTTGAGSFDFGTSGAPTLTTTASKADLLTFEAISIGGTLKLRYTGIARGFT